LTVLCQLIQYQFIQTAHHPGARVLAKSELGVVRHRLRRGQQEAEADHAADPLVQAGLLGAIGRTYFDLGRADKARDLFARVGFNCKVGTTNSFKEAKELFAALETLLDGALDDPADSRRFLEIVGRQADRLASIIEDLLALSRIEQSEGTGNLPRDEVPISSLLQAAGPPELVAKDPDAFVQLAASLAQDRARLTTLRTDLRGKLRASPLCDAPAYAARFHDAIRACWRQWCARPEGARGA